MLHFDKILAPAAEERLNKGGFNKSASSGLRRLKARLLLSFFSGTATLLFGRFTTLTLSDKVFTSLGGAALPREPNP